MPSRKFRPCSRTNIIKRIEAEARWKLSKNDECGRWARVKALAYNNNNNDRLTFERRRERRKKVVQQPGWQNLPPSVFSLFCFRLNFCAIRHRRKEAGVENRCINGWLSNCCSSSSSTSFFWPFTRKDEYFIKFFRRVKWFFFSSLRYNWFNLFENLFANASLSNVRNQNLLENAIFMRIKRNRWTTELLNKGFKCTAMHSAHEVY